MCGRYVLRTATPEIARILGVEGPLINTEARFNIAPTQSVPVVRAGPSEATTGRRMDALRWGLVPFWARDTKSAYRMINARAETVASKPAFRQAYVRRRCVVPADGYYEWQRNGATKQPYFIHALARGADGEPALLSFAGLWERWHRDAQEPVESFTIITTAASADVAAIHDRMPVLLDRVGSDRWLAHDAPPDAQLASLLQPAPPGTLAGYPISTRVNNVRNEGSACITRLGADGSGAH